MLAILLAVSMVLIPVNFPGSATAAEESPKYFEDTFGSDAYFSGVTEDGVTNKWDTMDAVAEDFEVTYKWNNSAFADTNPTATLADGKYTLTHQSQNDKFIYLDATGDAQAVNWKDYTVSADVTSHWHSAQSQIYLLGRTQKTANGYEAYFVTIIRNYNMRVGKLWWDGSTIQKALIAEAGIPQNSMSSSSDNTDMFDCKLSLTMQGNVITGRVDYIDVNGDAKYYEASFTDDGVTNGEELSYGNVGIGIMGPGTTPVKTAVYDNIKVVLDNGQVPFTEDFSSDAYFGEGKTETVTVLPEGVRWNYDVDYKWDTTEVASIGTQTDGQYQIQHSGENWKFAYLTAAGDAKATNWKDYTVSVDVNRNVTEKDTKVYLLTRVQKNEAGKYQAYFASLARNGNMYVGKLWWNESTSKIVVQHASSTGAALPDGVTGRLSVTVEGNTVTGLLEYDDGTGLKSYGTSWTDDGVTYGEELSYGTAGFGVLGNTGTSAITAKFDNIEVKLASGEKVFAEDFSTTDYFTGKTETVTIKPADSNGSYTVKYKWDDGEVKDMDTLADGKYTLVHTAGSDKFAYLNATGDAAATNWKDYTVSTNVSSHYHSSQSQVYLLGRVQKGEHGYEAYFVTIIRNNDLRVGKLWWNGSKIQKVLIAEAGINPALSANDPEEMFNCKLSLTVKGNTVTGLVEYGDGKTASKSFTDDGVTYGAELAYGNIGLGIMGVDSSANSSKTVIFEDVEVTLASGEKVFADDFTDDSYFGEGKEEAVTIKPEDSGWVVADGALSGKGNLYMTSTDGTNDLAAAWKDYAVDADVMLGDESTTASILANVTDDNYYELRLSNDSLALYRVTDGTEKRLATTKGTYNDRTFKLGQWHKLKLEINNDGKTVMCYANNEQLLVYVAETGETAHEAGRMGLRVTGSAKFDNVAAYAVELSDIKMFGTFKFEAQSLIDANWHLGTDWTVADKQLVKTGEGDTVAYLGSKCDQEDYNAQFQLTLPASGGVTVMGRYSADTNSAYKVTVDASAGVTLSKMAAGTDQTLTALTVKDLYIAGIKLEAGTEQNIKLYMYGNLIQVYLNDTRIIHYVDTDNYLTSGVAAIAGSTGTKLESVITTVALPLADLTVLGGTYGAADPETVIDQAHPIQVPLGKVPDVAKLWLKIGEDEIIPLDTLVIGQLDGSTVGVKTADVIYDGRVVKLYYEVVNRSEQITNLINGITALQAPEQLVSGDAAAVEALYRQFVDLSALEKATVEAATVEKLMAAREAILDLQYEEDLGNIIFTDTFDSSESEKLYTNDYNVTGQADVGNWYVVNGEMLQYDTNQVNQPTDFTAANMLLEKNFQVSSVSVDVQFMEAYAWVGFMFNMENREWYTLRITDNAKNNRLVLNKVGYATETYTTYTKTVDPTFEGFQVGQWYNLRVTVSETGLIRCYVDGRLWFEHQDVESADAGAVRSNGTVALIASENWVKYDNLEVRGVELPYVAADNMHENTDLPQQNYTDDFEDETVDSNPSHWVERSDDDCWLVKADGENKVYASKDSLDDATHTWLYVFESDVDYTAKLRADTLGKYPVMALTARVYADTSYFRAGYDFTVGKWFIKTRYGADFPELTVWGAEAAVSTDRWYTLNLKVEGTVIALYVDGNETPVAVADAGRKVGPGKVGVYAEQCNISVDDVDLKQLSGQSIVQDGAVDMYTAQAGTTAGTLFQILEVKDAEGRDALLLNEDSSNHYISYDGGMTWTKTTDYNTAGFAGDCQVKLHDGSILNIKNNMYVKRSTDGGLTWVTQCSDMTQYHAPGRKYLQPAEHLSEVQLADGTWRIFYTIGDQQKTTQNDGIVANRTVISEVYYSDDMGVTWKMSENSPLNVSNLSLWCESHVLGITKETVDFTGRTLPVGTLVHYSTYNSSDSMRYSLSFDGGVTWEGDYAMPEIPCGMNSMTIEYDYEDKVYYMATWMNIPKAHNIGFPRERVVLLTSEDGYNWKLVADVDRWGDVSSTDLGMLMQGVNMYLYIADEYVFVSFSRSEAFSSSGSHNLTQGRLYRFEKSKLTNIRDMKDQYVIPAKTVIGIEAQPAITQYKAGSQLDLTGNKIKVYYYDGTTELVDMADAFVNADLSAQGQTNVTVDYEHFRAVCRRSSKP